MNTVEFTKEDVKEYLDNAISYWRGSRESYSTYYVDAYQSVRMSLFGELLSKEGEDNARDR
ncbi:unnamed protein product [marine sediment metagenome]|uniref:Uncharacterized protein n=1 Tax=marine sediment metagenome TaxID=412755 RepID=X0X2Z0_9ZZZZ